MIDIATVSGAFQSLTLAKNLLGAAFDAKVDADAKVKIREALESLGNAQDGMFSLREELNRLQTERDELQRKLQDFELWSAKTQSYELAEAEGGAIVYKFNGSPLHYACPGCFNKRELYPLQDTQRHGKYRCTGCAAEYPVRRRQRLA